MTKLSFKELDKYFKLGYIHNPKHFIESTLWIEEQSGGRLILKGVCRHKTKKYTSIAILKKK